MQLTSIVCIVNMTLSTGIFPSKLKSAIVLPLLKKQNLDSESFKNYRPVSNLPYLSKVIEKVMACRLLEHMKENHLLDTLQSAYKKHTVLKQHFCEHKMTFSHWLIKKEAHF